MDRAKENLFKAIKIIAKEIEKNFDQTKTGRVIEVLDNSKYKVEIQGTKYTIKSKFIYEVGERVLVLFPCGSKTDLYLYPNK